MESNDIREAIVEAFETLKARNELKEFIKAELMQAVNWTKETFEEDKVKRNHGQFASKLDWFVDGVLSGDLQPLTNAIKVGEISNNVVQYLEKLGIKLGTTDIKLTYGKIKHITREDKKEAQKVSEEQLKRAEKIINENNVYYDTSKKNILYISQLNPEEINEERDWIKIPIKLNDKNGENIILTMSIIPAKDIFTDSKYKKID